MIQLATEPTASRSNWRPAPAESRDARLAASRRSGHAWPFISRLDERTEQPDSKRVPSPQSGS